VDVIPAEATENLEKPQSEWQVEGYDSDQNHLRISIRTTSQVRRANFKNDTCGIKFGTYYYINLTGPVMKLGQEPDDCPTIQNQRE
jgi:hypothetical protein